MISNDTTLPYDKTLLSKALTTTAADNLKLRTSEFLDNYDIECHLGYEVKQIDRKGKKVVFADGGSIEYDKLLLATGGRARVPDVAGASLANIHVLRSGADQEKIKEAAKEASNIVVVGGGFISSECAAHLQKAYKGKGKTITLLCNYKVPFEKQFGHEIGASILAEHEKNGVKVLVECNTRKMTFEGNAEGRVQKVVLEEGQEIPADLVIIGAGITPNNELAKSAGLTVDSANGGIKVNPFMQTSDSNIFAAGDIASVPHWYSGSNLRIEHWIVA